MAQCRGQASRRPGCVARATDRILATATLAQHEPACRALVVRWTTVSSASRQRSAALTSTGATGPNGSRSSAHGLVFFSQKMPDFC
jgi:nicotinamide mononucleotide (NMN) deamidase PncC